MFNFKQDLKDVNIMAPSKRREGCTLIEVKPDKDKDNVTQAVIFTWQEAKTGALLSMREFVPKRLEQMTDEQWKKSVELSASRLAHIVRAYVNDEEYASIHTTKDSKSLNGVIVKENWLEVVKQIAGLLKTKIAEKKTGDTALKVVLNENKGKYYAGLPKVPPFISTPNHPKDFTVNPQYDHFEIPAKGPKPDQELPQQGADQTNAFAGQAGGGNGAAPSSDDDF